MPSKQQHPEYQYLNLLEHILKNGTDKVSHSTGVGLRSVFGAQMRFDLSQGFPLLTTKKTFMRGIIHELIWFISGDSNFRYLTKNNVHIWDDWGYKNYLEKKDAEKLPDLTIDEFAAKMVNDDAFAKRWGELGPVYGVQWRHWPTKEGGEIDQLQWVVEKIRLYPQKKHYIVSAWNPEYIYEMAGSKEKSMAIAPCHTFYHININDNKLSLQLYQRSADMFLGVPFNIASYALLTLIIAQATGYEPGEFVHTFGDAHIYENHFEQVKEQIKRKPKPFPIMTLNPKKKEIDDFVFEDFTLEGYDPHPPIKGEITVVGGFNEKDVKGMEKKIVKKKKK